MDITTITPDMIAERFHQARVTSRDRCWKFLKVFGNIWNTCLPLFRNGRGEKILGTNPIPEVRIMLKNIRPDQPKRPVIPASELGAFIVLLEQVRSGEIRITDRATARVSPGTVRVCDLLLLCLFTAFRSGEARHLKWSYVDLENGHVRLPGTCREKGSGFEGTKNHRDHWVPLSSYARTLLERIYAERDPGSVYVFPAVHDPKVPIRLDLQIIRKISRRLGTPFNSHSMRRTFASIADDVGIGFLTIKRLLNHAYEGGVTGNYINPGFNPSKPREHFQKVCDYILDRRAEYLGEPKPSEAVGNPLVEIQRHILETGVDPAEVLAAIAAMSEKKKRRPA